MSEKAQLLAQVNTAVDGLMRAGSLDDVEMGLETNLDAAALHCNLAYALASLHLLRQRVAGELRKDDPALRLMKKIQQRSGRLDLLRQRVAGGAPLPALEKRESREGRRSGQTG